MMSSNPAVANLSDLTEHYIHNLKFHEPIYQGIFDKYLLIMQSSVHYVQNHTFKSIGSNLQFLSFVECNLR